MSQNSKKLQLTRETVKSLNVKAGVRAGDGNSVAQGGLTSQSGGGASGRGSPVGAGANPSGSITSVITSGLPSGGVVGR